MNKILVSGSVAYDNIMKFDGIFSDYILADKIQNLNVAFTVSELQKTDGGTAHNICYGLGLLGLKDQVIMLASVGKDFFIEKKISKYVNYDYVLRDDKLFTACAYIITDNKDNQITSFYPGAMANSVNQHINDYSDQNIKYVMISPNDKNAMLNQLKECKINNIKCFFDPGQGMTLFDKEELLDALGNANYLICNEYEFDWILDKSHLNKNDIVNMMEKIIITLGKDGVKLIDKEGEKIIAGLRLENIVDPTGAGDGFRSGLLFGLIKGLSWEDAVGTGNVAASFVLMSQGTLNHVFTLDDIKNKFEETYKYKINF